MYYRKWLAVLVAAVMIAGLFPAAAFSELADPEGYDFSADYGFVYGIEAVTGDIYKINPNTGEEIMIYDNPNSYSPAWYPNALAFDEENGRLYFTSSQNDLWFYDFSSSDSPDALVNADPNNLFSNSDNVLGATFAGGYYWYVLNRSALLYRVELNSDGEVTGVTWVKMDDDAVLTMGDIVAADGVVYGSSGTGAGGNEVFFVYEIGSGDYESFGAEGTRTALQLAWGLNGSAEKVLFGQLISDKSWYTVDTADGDRTLIGGFTGDVAYEDLASGPVEIPETYSICGNKYLGNTFEGLQGWEIRLYRYDPADPEADADGYVYAGSEWTDISGGYCFTDLPEGTYKVSEVLDPDYIQLYPENNEHIVVLPGGESYGGEGNILYGTQRNNGSNNGLYEIDLDAGIATRLFNAGGSGNSPNGLGFDPVNKRLYYMYVSESAPLNSELYFYDLQAGTEASANLSLPGEVVVGASFYEGAYYYIPNLTSNLHKVTLNPDGTYDEDILLWENFNGENPAVYRFGDFAINREGMLYSSTNDTGGSTAEFFSLNVATGEYTLIADSTVPDAALLLQVSFASDGTLYGHSAGSGEFFTIDLQTGVKSSVGYVESDVRTRELFSDLASGIQPYDFRNEPVEREQVCGNETVWAAQKHPGETRFSNAANWGTYVGYTKGSGTVEEPVVYPLYAGQSYLAGWLYVYDTGDSLFVEYVSGLGDFVPGDHDPGCVEFTVEGVCDVQWSGLLEYHLAVAQDEDGIPRTRTGRNSVLSNPIPGQFEYKDSFETAQPGSGLIVVDITGLDSSFVIAAHGVMQWCGYLCEPEAD